MNLMDSQNSEIALLFPPFLFNTFHGPYLAIPHLHAFLRARGVTNIHVCDVNSRVIKELSQAAQLEALAQEVHELLKSAHCDAARRHLLHQKYVLRYILENGSCMNRDETAYRLFGAVVHGLLNALIKKDVSSQIACVDRGFKLPFLFNIVEQVIAELSPATKLIGISVPTADQFYAALQLASTARKRFQDAVHITLGGCLFSLMDQPQLTCILATNYVDSIVRFEGEKSLLGLCRYVKKQAAFDQIPNLFFFRDGGLHATPVETPVSIDECPAPLFQRDELQAYRGEFYLPVLVTHGCYWGRCTFCDYVHLTGRKRGMDVKSVSRLIAEIEQQVDTHSVRNFELVTECLPPALSRKLARAIKHRGLAIHWKTYLRIDERFSQQLCRQMFDAGCRKVNMGVDSFSDRQLHLMQKGYARSQIITVLNRLKRSGIQVTLSLIPNFAGVTLPEMQETLDALIQHRDLFEALHVYPFVLSRLSQVAKSPSQFGIELKESADRNHTRGFHYIQFSRLSGVSAQDEKRMLSKYYQLSQGHRRQQLLEKSLQVLENTDPEVIVIRPQQRLLFLSGAEPDSVIHLLNLAPPQKGEVLFFDLESKAVMACPLIIKQIYNALDRPGTRLSAVKQAIDAGGRNAAERDALFKKLLTYGIYLGFFSLQLDLTQRSAAYSAATKV